VCPAGHTIEKIESNVNSIRIAAPDNLLSDGLQFVGQKDHMVAIPTNASADVKQDLVKKGYNWLYFECSSPL